MARTHRDAALLHKPGEAKRILLNWRLCSNLQEAVHEADLILHTSFTSEALAASDHTHDCEALDGGCRCLHRLEASSRLDDSRERAMICLDNAVQVFRQSRPQAGRKLTAVLETLDGFRVRAELICSDR